MTALTVDQVRKIDHARIYERVWFKNLITTLIKVINYLLVLYFGQIWPRCIVSRLTIERKH